VLYMNKMLSAILVIGLLFIPISVNATDNVFIIPDNVIFPNGATIQFKSTCSNPTIVRVADEKQSMTVVVAHSNSTTIHQGGTYKLVCSDKTPPQKIEESIGPFLRYSPSTKTFWAVLNKDLDPESGIDSTLSTLTVNGQRINFIIEGNWINLGTNNVKTIEYNLVNGQGLSTGKQTYTFPSTLTFREPNISIKPDTTIDTITIKKQVPIIHRDVNNNLIIEGIEGSNVKGLSRGTLYGTSPSSLTKEHYNINSNKIMFLYNKTPNNTYISRATILFSDSFVSEYEYQFMPNQIYNLVEDFKIQHQKDKLVITTKGFGLPLSKVGIDYYYFYIDSPENKAMPSSYADPEGLVYIDDAERTFVIDLSKLQSGKYRLMMYAKTKDSNVQLHNYVADVYVSTPKQSTSTKAYSITVNKDMTTIKINPGATISGIKINGVQAITTNNSVASLSFKTFQIPNWAYDTIEPIVTNYTPPTPPTPPTPITSTTIVLQIGSKNMYVNGKLVILDSVPIVRNDRTLLPIRFVAEALGAQVGWDEAQQKVTIQDSKTKIEMWINKPTAIVNGKTVYIDPANYKVVPILVNGRTMLPVRFVSESLGAQVKWNEAQQKVTITK